MIVELFSHNVDSILEIYASDFKDGWNRGQLLSAFSSGRFVSFAVKKNDKIVSVITCSVSFEEADLEGIVTLKEHKNKGYAKALIEHLIAFLKEKKVEKLFLEVREGNLSAINLYKKVGFNQISIRKKYYQNGENALIMVKEI
ncbi:MAG: ribosomal protein S18-alanine N-acetyltransferase [Clostridia bacterium]|nr:ribosomal protein S18-alanine N-acetyltransferase [Clostridia bacterium]